MGLSPLMEEDSQEQEEAKGCTNSRRSHACEQTVVKLEVLSTTVPSNGSRS